MLTKKKMESWKKRDQKKKQEFAHLWLIKSSRFAKKSENLAIKIFF